MQLIHLAAYTGRKNESGATSKKKHPVDIYVAWHCGCWLYIVVVWLVDMCVR